MSCFLCLEFVFVFSLKISLKLLKFNVLIFGYISEHIIVINDKLKIKYEMLFRLRIFIKKNQEKIRISP